MSDTPPRPALDVQAQLAALQDQLDDLVAVVTRQQETIDALERRTRPTVVRRAAGPADGAARRR